MRTAVKALVTEESCNPFSEGFICEVGKHPRPSTCTAEGQRNFHGWQTRGYLTLYGEDFSILNAPTGSGKSTVQKALAFAYDLKLGELTVIAVPDTMISGSFKAEFDIEYLLPNGMVMAWKIPPENFLFVDKGRITEAGTIDSLIDFVTKRCPPKGARVIVCTHAALVGAHKKLVAKYGKKAWKRKDGVRVNVFIDEAHHSKYGDLEEEGKEEDETQRRKRCNELGRLVEHYVNNQPGRMMLTTATMLRGDSASIVPSSCIDQFKEFELPVHEYLDGLVHLKEIAFKFSIAESYEESLQIEVARADMKTLVYQPIVKAGEGSLAKLKRLASYQKAIGSSKPTGDGFTRTHASQDNRKVVSMDLVTVDGRDEIRALFEKNKGVPDLAFVQNLFREGADWTQAERSLVFGARGSLPMLIQMLGRLLRDFCPNGTSCPGCGAGKARVEFHIILPKTITADLEEFETYTGTIFTVMALGWLFQTSLAIAPRLRTQRLMGRIINQCRETSMRGTGGQPAGEALRDILRGAVNDLGGGGPPDEEEVEEASKSLTSCLKGAFRLAASAVRHMMGNEDAESLSRAIENDPFNAIGLVYETQWGAKQFREFRERWNGLPEVTPRYVQQVIFLHRCKDFQRRGLYNNPRGFEGAVELFGSAEALDKACTAEGL